MVSISSTFSLDTRVAFAQHLWENPNNRRVSQSEKEILIEWLTNPYKRPSSQEEFSRRNYVRKTFVWDENSRTLLAIPKNEKGKDRMVVTTDMIANVVETVHEDNDHAGWDATWKDVSTSYYGILRSDIIFLLKQCQICAGNPSKRPRGSAATTRSPQRDNESTECLNTCDVQNDKAMMNGLEKEMHEGE